MNSLLTVGILLTALSVAGYLVGLTAPYPGRALSITGVMVGITLLGIGNAERGGDTA